MVCFTRTLTPIRSFGRRAWRGQTGGPAVRPRVSSVGRISTTGNPDHDGLCRDPARGAALLQTRLRNCGQSPLDRLGNPVESRDRHLPRHVDTARPQIVHRREGQHVGGAHQCGDARVGGQRQFGGGATRGRGSCSALSTTVSPSGLSPAAAIASRTPPIRSLWTRKRVLCTRSGSAIEAVAPPVSPFAAESHCQQPDFAVPEPDDVVGQFPHRGAVVDADAGCAGNVGGLIDDHHGQLPLQHQLQIGVVIGGRVDDEPVHARRHHGAGALVDTAAGTRPPPTAGPDRPPRRIRPGRRRS